MAKKKTTQTSSDFPAHDRQGDILVMDSTETEFGERLDKNGEAVVALGEATGHRHVVYDGAAEQLAGKKEPRARFLRVVKTEALLRHEEHAPIPLDSPVKRTIRQSEYSPEELRQVAD